MTARPVYVAVIGWLLIVIGLLSLVSVALAMAFPGLAQGASTAPGQIIGNLAASIIELVCGAFILKGADWARWLYLVLSITSAAYLFIAGAVPTGVLIGWVIFAVLTLAGLFTPDASRFFKGAAPVEVPPQG
jgi:bacteriorhodopsin